MLCARQLPTQTRKMRQSWRKGIARSLLGLGDGQGAHLSPKTPAAPSKEGQNSPTQQHAKSQISPMVRPRASNEGAFDRLASWSTQLKHRLVALASSSLRYVTVARRYGLFDCSDFFIPPRIALGEYGLWLLSH